MTTKHLAYAQDVLETGTVGDFAFNEAEFLAIPESYVPAPEDSYDCQMAYEPEPNAIYVEGENGFCMCYFKFIKE